jgi:hypothetical protein
MHDVLVMRSRHHWRLAMYDEYIVTIRNRMLNFERSTDQRARLETLLKGWIDLRGEFEAELAFELAREKQEAVSA